jgi:hypothetical protein
MAQRGEMLRGAGSLQEAGQIAAKLAAIGHHRSISNVAKV